MIKLAVFDLDDTLLRSDKTLDVETLDTIHTLKARGVEIAIATGRNIPMSLPFAKALGASGLLAGNNGSIIIDLKSDKVVEEHFVDKTAQKKTIEYCFTNDHPFVIYTKEGVFTPMPDRISVYEDWNARHPNHSVHYENMETVEALSQLDSHKVLMIVEDPSVFNATYEHFKNLDDAHVTKSSKHYIDVLPNHISKAYALKQFMAHYGVSAEETIAFGDSDNDAEMLKLSGTAYAMNNATPLTKASANYVTAYDNNDAGVAHALKNHFTNL